MARNRAIRFGNLRTGQFLLWDPNGGSDQVFCSVVSVESSGVDFTGRATVKVTYQLPTGEIDYNWERAGDVAPIVAAPVLLAFFASLAG